MDLYTDDSDDVCTHGNMRSQCHLGYCGCPPETDSRPAAARPHGLASLAATPMDELRFRDFAALKVPGGRDRYSRMRLDDLLTALDEAQREAALSMGDDDAAAVARWMLRGLPTDHAIRKVATDCQLRQQARVSAGMGPRRR